MNSYNYFIELASANVNFPKIFENPFSYLIWGKNLQTSYSSRPVRTPARPFWGGCGIEHKLADPHLEMAVKFEPGKIAKRPRSQSTRLVLL